MHPGLPFNVPGTIWQWWDKSSTRRPVKEKNHITRRESADQTSLKPRDRLLEHLATDEEGLGETGQQERYSAHPQEAYRTQGRRPSNNLMTGDGEREFRTQSAQNFGDKMLMFTKTDKVDRFKQDNLKISKEKLERLSLSGNDFVGHLKPKQSKEKPPVRDNLKLATGKLEDLTTSNTDFKGHRSKSSSGMKPSWYQQPHSSVTHG